ncbi:hypothetical protein LXT21_44150 [Myxococcus sp. K38C18041901]|uniref:hypothetical protein n=1 Tax=Myxococcus guangdongensis TaxID=2906760 RepID=UPI0020A81301|nr:hypothetical protein [Myxococcus guangdongensis]MCP3065782.1 hypothetical protein [Myxococcus guangdongensis]
MSPAASPRPSLREDFARHGEKLEAVAARADEAKRTSEKYAIDTHRLIESMREELRALAERMATAEQVRRIEEHVRRVDERVDSVDRRVTAQTSVVEAVPKLVERMDELKKQLGEQDTLVKSIPDLSARMTSGEHRASHIAGALWVVGALVALLGLAGLRELGRWFVQVAPPAPALHQEEPALPSRRRQ